MRRTAAIAMTQLAWIALLSPPAHGAPPMPPSGPQQPRPTALSLDGSLAPAKPGVETETYTGYLEIDPARYGKGVQAVTVHVPGGRRIPLTIRYLPEHLQYANKQVRVTGYMAQSSDDPRVQSYSYFRATSLELAPGEVPYPAPPKQVPAPPVVRSKKDIDALPGGWGAAVGKATFRFEKGHRGVGATIESVTLRLEDGLELTKHLWWGVGDTAAYGDGVPGTMVFRYTRSHKEPVRPFAFCLGEQPRCGMDGEGGKR